MRTRFRGAAIFLISLVIVTSAAWAQSGFYLKDGDRVVFYGDSITDQRLYTTFVETFVLTRFPKLDVRFIHSGWGGDRVSGGGGGNIDVRLQRDVIAYQPTVMTIMLGMNDASYRAFDPAIFQKFTTGYQDIVKTIKKALPQIRITVIQPSPYDDATRPAVFDGGYNAVLLLYGHFVQELAKREKLTFADLNKPVVEALQKANVTDHETALKIVPDRVHPGPGGHLLMAEGLLKAWGAPANVTSVSVDAADKRVTREEHTEVGSLETDKGVAWRQLDESLPMPIDMKDPVIALAVNSSDFVEALNQQWLRVTGLAAGRYALKIDGEAVGTFSDTDLAQEVNLALLPTPMARQAAEVHALTLRHNNIHNLRWRQLQVPLQEIRSPHLRTAMDELDALEQDVIKQQRAAAQPKSRRYELVMAQ